MSALTASSPSVVLRLDGVVRRFTPEAPPTLGPIQLTVSAGEFVSVLGPSGCGKSTLLRLASGLDAPDAGTVQVDDAPPTRHDGLAYVFQDATLLPWLSVAANVETLLRLRGVPAAERARRCRAALEQVRLVDRSRALPRELSGGQKMRVSLARALALEPRLLLLDEPFAALDELARERLGEELLAIRARLGWTALFVTHSVAEAVFLSTRVIILGPHPGRIVHDIPIELPGPRQADLRRNPAYLGLVADVAARLRALEDAPATP